jgi:hypothetical protein
MQKRAPQRIATLDQDEILVETAKRDALFGYKGFKSYQPLNISWAEQQLVLHTEFRDGERLIHWHRERCGQSEEAHSVMKRDFAGGKLPSGDFGENVAW